MHVTIGLFWSECNDFNHINVPCNDEKFIWISKYIRNGHRNLFHHNYSLPFTKVFVFVSCRVTSKVLVISYAASSWGDVNVIESGKRSAIRSDVAYKQSIVYTYACIE